MLSSIFGNLLDANKFKVEIQLNNNTNSHNQNPIFVTGGSISGTCIIHCRDIEEEKAQAQNSSSSTNKKKNKNNYPTIRGLTLTHSVRCGFSAFQSAQVKYSPKFVSDEMKAKVQKSKPIVKQEIVLAGCSSSFSFSSKQQQQLDDHEKRNGSSIKKIPSLSPGANDDTTNVNIPNCSSTTSPPPPPPSPKFKSSSFEITIKPGTYCYPFEIPIPEWYPSSISPCVLSQLNTWSGDDRNDNGLNLGSGGDGGGCCCFCCPSPASSSCSCSCCERLNGIFYVVGSFIHSLDVRIIVANSMIDHTLSKEINVQRRGDVNIFLKSQRQLLQSTNNSVALPFVLSKLDKMLLELSADKKEQHHLQAKILPSSLPDESSTVFSWCCLLGNDDEQDESMNNNKKKKSILNVQVSMPRKTWIVGQDSNITGTITFLPPEADFLEEETYDDGAKKKKSTKKKNKNLPQHVLACDFELVLVSRIKYSSIRTAYSQNEEDYSTVEVFGRNTDFQSVSFDKDNNMILEAELVVSKSTRAFRQQSSESWKKISDNRRRQKQGTSTANKIQVMGEDKDEGNISSAESQQHQQQIDEFSIPIPRHLPSSMGTQYLPSDKFFPISICYSIVAVPMMKKDGDERPVFERSSNSKTTIPVDLFRAVNFVNNSEGEEQEEPEESNRNGNDDESDQNHQQLFSPTSNDRVPHHQPQQQGSAFFPVTKNPLLFDPLRNQNSNNSVTIIPEPNFAPHSPDLPPPNIHTAAFGSHDYYNHHQIFAYHQPPPSASAHHQQQQQQNYTHHQYHPFQRVDDEDDEDEQETTILPVAEEAKIVQNESEEDLDNTTNITQDNLTPIVWATPREQAAAAAVTVLMTGRAASEKSVSGDDDADSMMIRSSLPHAAMLIDTSTPRNLDDDDE